MKYLLLSSVLLLLAGCTPGSHLRAVESTQSQVQLRSVQSRSFDTGDQKKLLRAVISTMQDLDFVVENADELLGTVTGSKFYGSQSVKMTVTVKPRGSTQSVVRANARYGLHQVTEPAQYQDFFSALEKALFLTAQQVD